MEGNNALIGAARRQVAVIGSGPAGLMAAEVLAAAGHAVTVFDQMPSFGRKLLMAGRGGLNLTHGEPLDRFLDRYGPARAWLEPAIRAFPPAAAIAWCEGLGQQTFVGTSGRVFPRAFKASPLLRAWLGRLADAGVTMRPRHRWTGWSNSGDLVFTDGEGRTSSVQADATVLALGGASWPRLGSDGAWVATLEAVGVAVTPLEAANCGCHVAWSAHFVERFAGMPLKRVAVQLGADRARGEAVVTRTGLEGGVIYALTPQLRAALARDGTATLTIDLRPDQEVARLEQDLAEPAGKRSLSNWLRRVTGLAPVSIALLREAANGVVPRGPEALARSIKACPVTVTATAPIARAISTAGGVSRSALDAHGMLRVRPGVFVAGEMLDWEAPTGGYLLQGVLATGRAAGLGAARWLANAE